MHYFRSHWGILPVSLKWLLILTIIGQCETKHMTLLLKNGNVSFEGLDIHNITSITAHPISLAAILTVIFIYWPSLLTLFYLYVLLIWWMRRDDYLMLESVYFSSFTQFNKRYCQVTSTFRSVEWSTVKVLLFVDTNFRAFYKMHWSLGSWKSWFQTLQATIDGFLYSWFKWTTKSVEIRNPTVNNDFIVWRNGHYRVAACS